MLAGGKVLGAVLRDDLINRDELVSTVEGLADTDGASTGRTSLARWIDENADSLGRKYVNERRNRS